MISLKQFHWLRVLSNLNSPMFSVLESDKNWCLTIATCLQLSVSLLVQFNPIDSSFRWATPYGIKLSDCSSRQQWLKLISDYFGFVLGTSEAFLHAVATENQLKRSNDSLLVFSLIYVALNVLLIRSAGAVGLILANSLSILVSVWKFSFVPFFFHFHGNILERICIGWAQQWTQSIYTTASKRLKDSESSSYCLSSAMNNNWLVLMIQRDCRIEI